jgi:hypothetical protein
MAPIHAAEDAGNHNVIRRNDGATMQGEHDPALARDRAGE